MRLCWYKDNEAMRAWAKAITFVRLTWVDGKHKVEGFCRNHVHNAA